MWGFGYGDAIGVTAAPLNSDVGDQILMVKDVQTEGDANGAADFLHRPQHGPGPRLGVWVKFFLYLSMKGD